LAVIVIVAFSGQLPDFAKTIRIQKAIDTLAYRQLSAIAVPRDLFRPAHLFGQLFAIRQLMNFCLPIQL